MYENFAELVRALPFSAVTMDKLLELPEDPTEVRQIREYLGAVADAEDILKLQDETVGLFADEDRFVVDSLGFMRALSMLPAIAPWRLSEQVDAICLTMCLDDFYLVQRDLAVCDGRCFELMLTELPDEVVEMWFESLHDVAAEVDVLSRLVSGGYIFDIDETVVRTVVMGCDMITQDMVYGMFEEMEIDFDIDPEAEYDPAWRDADECDDDCCPCCECEEPEPCCLAAGADEEA